MKKIKSEKSKRYFRIFLLILAAGSIYPIVYLRTNFQLSITTVFNLTVEKLGYFYSMLGMMFVIGYIPSGWLADKISPKKLITLSLIGTGVAGIFFAQIPDKRYLIFIYLAWGFFTVLTFWSSLLKGIKLLANKDEQARVFGFLDGGRGFIEAILGTVAVSLFTFILAGRGEEYIATKQALVSVIYMYAIFCIVIGVMIFIVMDDKTGASKTAVDKDKTIEPAKNKNNFIKDFKSVILIKEVWLTALMIFCGYSAYWTVYYYSGFLQVSHGASSVFAGYISVIVLWMRPLGGIGGGWLGDKFGKTKIYAIALLSSALLLITSAFLPISNLMIFSTLVILAGFMGYVIRGLYWSMLDDCNIEPNLLGQAIGLVSFIGYLPDIIIPAYSGKIFTAYQDGAMAYSLYFLVSAIFAFCGVFITFLFHKSTKSKKN